MVPNNDICASAALMFALGRGVMGKKRGRSVEPYPSLAVKLSRSTGKCSGSRLLMKSPAKITIDQISSARAFKQQLAT